MRGGEHGPGVTLTGDQAVVQPVRLLRPGTHVEGRTHQGADHVVAEGVRLHRGDDDAVPAAGELEPLEFPDGGGAFPRFAVGAEVLQPQQPRGALVEQRGVERLLVPERGVPAHRVPAPGAVRDPVAVAPPQRREPGVEAFRGRRGPVHLDGPAQLAQAAAECPAEPAQQRGAGIQFGAAVQALPFGLGQVQVHHLSARVHAGVGAAGHRDPHRPADQQGEGLLEHALDRTASRLQRPPAEGSAVVRQVQPDTQKPAAPHNGGSGFELVHRLKSIRRF